MRSCFLFAISALLFCSSVGAAQSTQELPRVLLIYREDAKPARGPVHSRVEQAFAQYWAKQKVQPFLALEAWSGNPNEVMFITGYDSLASMEKDYQLFGGQWRRIRLVDTTGGRVDQYCAFKCCCAASGFELSA